MNNKQQNKLSMYRTVHSHLSGHATVTAGLSAVAPAVTALADGIAEIETLAAQQAQPVQVASIDKHEALGALADATVATAAALTAYAAAQNASELLAKVKLTPSGFQGLRAAERLTRAQMIHDEAAALVDSLGGQGVTAESLTALQAAIDEATASVTAPREAVGAKRTATVGLEAVYDRIDALLERQLDPLVLTLKTKEPAFYAGYHSARVIVDHSVSGATAKGTTALKAPAAAAAETPASTPTPAGT